jgi:aminoglycoside phosphotransferase (APT) family kinase protein
MKSNQIPNPVAILKELGIDRPDAIQRVTGGTDTLVWQVTHNHQHYALRVFQPNQRERCERECRVMELAQAAGLPVPRIVASGNWTNYPVLLMTWCSGRPLAEELKRRPWRVWALGHAFGQLQARLHSIPGDPHLGQTWISWKNNDFALAQALQRQTHAAPALLHLDYHLGNVIVDNGKMTGIIDWANAQVGDPRADLARTLSILRVEPWHKQTSPVMTVFRWLFARAWQAGYTQIAGWPDEMALFYSWAGEVMVTELNERTKRPESWITHRHLAQVQCWTNTWKNRAGLRIIKVH